MHKEPERDETGRIVSPGLKYSEEKLLNQIKEANQKVDGKLTQRKYNEVADIGHSVLCDRFGSWNDAKSAAGVAAHDEVANVGKREQQRRITEIKESEPCESCGDNRSAVAMDFHHTAPEEKTAPIAEMCNAPCQYGWDEVIEEIEKCVLVCKSCHAEIEWGERTLHE